MLRAALEDDPFYAPAMNDLATALLLEPQADLREAARLLEAAAKLMPGNPTPRYNLGLVLERAGLADDALAAFASALEADPRHPPSLQAIVSLQLRHWPTDLSGGARPQIPSAAPSAPRNRRVPGSLDGPALVAALRTVTRDGTTPAWRAWAADLLRRSDAGP
jgi:tetratricopeptide (TPR) repeat protein